MYILYKIIINGMIKKVMDKKTILTGAVAAAAGLYLFLNDDESKPVREKSKSWMLKAKSEIADKLEATEEVSEEKYHEIVSEVMSKYHDVAEKDEVDELKEFLRNNWKKLLARAAASAAATIATKKTMSSKS